MLTTMHVKSKDHKKKTKPSETIKKYYSEQDGEQIADLGKKVIDVICKSRINFAVMALELAKEYLECKIDEVGR